MSGGSHDYAYEKVDAFIELILDRSWGDGAVRLTPLRRLFIRHLKLVSAAMKAVEWVDSGDCSSPHDDMAIRRVLKHRRLRG